MLRVAEVDLDVGRQGELLMVRHLAAAIPGQRLVEFPGQLAGMANECVDDRLGVLARRPNQHHVTRLSFHQRRDLAVVAAEQQVAFPVTRDGPILSLRGLLADRYGVGDLAQPFALERLVPRTAHRSRLAKIL